MAVWALLDLGAVASSTAASPSGSRASGNPSCKAASTQLFTTVMACGYASPISSAAMHSSRLPGEIRSPATSSLPR